MNSENTTKKVYDGICCVKFDSIEYLELFKGENYCYIDPLGEYYDDDSDKWVLEFNDHRNWNVLELGEGCEPKGLTIVDGKSVTITMRYVGDEVVLYTGYYDTNTKTWYFDNDGEYTPCNIYYYKNGSHWEYTTD